MSKPTPAPRPPLSLYGRPGFMIRRAHQIAVSVFIEETADLGVTPTQFGILDLLHHRPNIDQISLSRLLGLDRSTTGMVVTGLEGSGLIARVTDAKDKRRRALTLTGAGHDLLDRLRTPASRAVDRLLLPLTPPERQTFLRLIAKLTAALNETTRVPLLVATEASLDRP